MASTPKAPSKPKPIVDTSFVSADKIEELRAKAQSQVADERNKAAEDQLLEKMLVEERRKTGLEERLVTLTLDLAPHADKVMLDGTMYMHGHTVTVPRSVAVVLMEAQERGWNHQSVIDGKSENFYRKARNTRVGHAGAVAAPTINGLVRV